MWIVYAVLSAVFASLTSILAKIGIDGVNSNLATAIRTGVVLVLAWGIVFFTGAQQGIQEITKRSMLFLVLSGIATGLSWLCYYKAIQLDGVSRVVPIDKFSIVLTLILATVFLREQMTVKTIIGAVLITAGTVTMIL
ncbi:MAG: EamA family transporter [Spirochaetaceae bacterium]|jgi:transporter family protein|nr:EamA family transporter [Spirochaetaceae bacterium]